VSCASSEVLEQVEVWSAFVIDRYKFAVKYGAGRHIAQRVYDIIEFAVKGISCARIKIDAIIGLDGNCSVAIDFYFPYPIGRVRQLCYGETVHRLHKLGGSLRKRWQL